MPDARIEAEIADKLLWALEALRLGDHHPLHVGTDDLCDGRGIARCFQGRCKGRQPVAAHIDASEPLEFAVLPGHRLGKGAMNVHIIYERTEAPGRVLGKAGGYYRRGSVWRAIEGSWCCASRLTIYRASLRAIMSATLSPSRESDMGLDIRAYRGLQLAPAGPLSDDASLYLREALAYNRPGLPLGRADGLHPEMAYSGCEDSFVFQAGSYMYYSKWRNQLAEMAGLGSAEAVGLIEKRKGCLLSS